MNEAKEELDGILNDDRTRDSILLVFNNKVSFFCVALFVSLLRKLIITSKLSIMLVIQTYVDIIKTYL